MVLSSSLSKVNEAFSWLGEQTPEGILVTSLQSSFYGDAMSYDKIGPVAATAMRADEYSDDGKNIVISLKTKYSAAERRYSVPIECLGDLLIDLKRLNVPTDAASSSKTAIDPVALPIQEESEDG